MFIIRLRNACALCLSCARALATKLLRDLWTLMHAICTSRIHIWWTLNYARIVCIARVRHVPVQKRRCRAGVRAGHIAVIALRLGVRRLLLMVEHLLAKVRTTVFLQLCLGKTALVRCAAFVLWRDEEKNAYHWKTHTHKQNMYSVCEVHFTFNAQLCIAYKIIVESAESA